jgi:hypothetical protein
MPKSVKLTLKVFLVPAILLGNQARQSRHGFVDCRTPHSEVATNGHRVFLFSRKDKNSIFEVGIADHFTRESAAIWVGNSIPVGQVVVVLERLRITTESL